MKIETHPAPPPEEAMHQEDTTPEFGPAAQFTAHRRTTVIVERETLSFLVRRSLMETGATPTGQSPAAKTVPETPGKYLPAAARCADDIPGETGSTIIEK
jgi:hypothetical protein